MANDYVISALGPNPSVTVQSGTTNTTACSLKLVGRGAPGYGFNFAENTLRHLSNFANTVAPANPLVGQIWYDSSANQLKVRNSSSQWMLIPSTTSTYIQPSQGGLGLAPTAGDANKILKVNSSGTGYELVVDTWLSTIVSKSPATDNSIDLGDATHRFKRIYSVNFIGTALEAYFADLAERYEADEQMEPGDVVELGGEKEVTKSKEKFSSNVFGVVSENPAFKMNSGAGDDTTHPYIALAGRVPVKVIGKVKKGQRLVSSDIPGVAMAVGIHEVISFHVIGRALSNKITDGVDLIEATIGAK